MLESSLTLSKKTNNFLKIGILITVLNPNLVTATKYFWSCSGHILWYNNHSIICQDTPKTISWDLGQTFVYYITRQNLVLDSVIKHKYRSRFFQNVLNCQSFSNFSRVTGGNLWTQLESTWSNLVGFLFVLVF